MVVASFDMHNVLLIQKLSILFGTLSIDRYTGTRNSR
uniref:Uncharacterized protein n=1 Tax=Anguilla anguilla TaxID=7936 RepID=A0A0E9RC12_ANGAN